MASVGGKEKNSRKVSGEEGRKGVQCRSKKKAFRKSTPTTQTQAMGMKKESMQALGSPKSFRPKEERGVGAGLRCGCRRSRIGGGGKDVSYEAARRVTFREKKKTTPKGRCEGRNTDNSKIEGKKKGVSKILL